jgi:hypothetical protein
MPNAAFLGTLRDKAAQAPELYDMDTTKQMS